MQQALFNFIFLGRLNRFSRNSRVPARVEKPVDCAKLHNTEDTPFVAILLNRATGRFLCMGSIIDEKHILTAVRCVQSTNYKTLRILVGYFKAWWGRHSFVHYVDKVIKSEYELVILRLTLPIQFSRTIRPIRLLRIRDIFPDKDPDKPPPPPPAYKGGSSKKGDEKKGQKPAEGTDSDTDDKPKEKPSKSDSEPNSDAVNDEDDGNKPTDDDYDTAPELYDDLPDAPVEDNEEYKADDDDEEILNEVKAKVENKENNENGKGEIKDENKEQESSVQNPVSFINNDNHKGKRLVNHKNVYFKSVKFNDFAKTNQQISSVADVEENIAIYKRYGEPPENKTFKDFYDKVIKSVLVVGFPLTDEDAVGDPIPQTLVYGMREENYTTEAEDSCIKEYIEKATLSEKDDPHAAKRIICTEGKSKFCWGCLGGPTLWKREKEYIQVGVVTGAKCDNKTRPQPLMHSRVDIHIKWISKNSYVHFRN